MSTIIPTALIFNPGNGSNKLSIAVASGLSSNVAWTIPNSNTAGCFYNNGSGVVSWNSSFISFASTPATNELIKYNGANLVGTGIISASAGTAAFSVNNAGTATLLTLSNTNTTTSAATAQISLTAGNGTSSNTMTLTYSAASATDNTVTLLPSSINNATTSLQFSAGNAFSLVQDSIVFSGTKTFSIASNWSQTGVVTFSTGTGAVSLNGTTTSRAILPAANATYDLGTTGTRYRTGYFYATLDVNNNSGNGNWGIININGAYSTQPIPMIFLYNNGTGNGTMAGIAFTGYDSSAVRTSYIYGGAGLTLTPANGSISLNGPTSVSGSNTFATGTGNVSINGSIITNITQTGATTFATGSGAVTLNGTTTSKAILPATTNTYDLGSSSAKYANAYFGTSLNVAGTSVLSGTITTGLGSSQLVQTNGSSQLTVSNTLPSGCTANNLTMTGTTIVSNSFGVGNPVKYALSADPSTNIINTYNNTLDDGSGNVTLAGTLTMNSSGGIIYTRVVVPFTGDSYYIGTPFLPYTSITGTILQLVIPSIPTTAYSNDGIVTSTFSATSGSVTVFSLAISIAASAGNSLVISINGIGSGALGNGAEQIYSGTTGVYYNGSAWVFVPNVGSSVSSTGIFLTSYTWGLSGNNIVITATGNSGQGGRTTTRYTVTYTPT